MKQQSEELGLVITGNDVAIVGNTDIVQKFMQE